MRADGMADSVKVVMAHRVFREHVEEALKQWAFEPTGKPVLLKVTVKFSLTEDCDKTPAESLNETRVQADLPNTVFINTCIEPITVTNN